MVVSRTLVIVKQVFALLPLTQTRRERKRQSPGRTTEHRQVIDILPTMLFEQTKGWTF